MDPSTRTVVGRSLALVGWDAVPADSAVHLPGDDIETALVGIDGGSVERPLAHRPGFDLTLARTRVSWARAGRTGREPTCADTERGDTERERRGDGG